MRASKITAIILKRLNFGESDRIVTVFSKERGKLSVVAKGIRRIKSRRAPHLEPLGECDITLHRSRDVEIVTEAKKTEASPKRNLLETGYLFYAAEVIDKLLPENEPHEDIYFLFKNFLKSSLDEAQAKQFTLELLWQLGFFPRGQFPRQGLTTFVESLAERQIKSKTIIDKV